jgi:RNA 2',3'-cyclic 3'-phosphodiesterase
LFAGVVLPADVMSALVEVQRALGMRALPFRFERAEKLHITVRFIGATAEDRVAPIVEALRSAAGMAPLHEVTLAESGAFPSVARPGVVWIGLSGAVDALVRLERCVDESLREIGIPGEQRNYHPHITIARVNRPASGETRRAMSVAIEELAAPPPLRIPVERVVLFESVAAEGGTRYVIVDSLPLGRN